MLALVALGGNALLRDGQQGTINEQNENTVRTLESLMFLVEQGYNLVITHGNGPQVGNIMLRNDAGEMQYGIAQMPLDICVADSQGGIGYMIERNLHNVLNRHGLVRNVITLVTQVLVEPDDEAFRNPAKRIGRKFTKDESEELSRIKGWRFKPDKNEAEKFRRVVPSPEPVGIMNEFVVKQNALEGTIVIAAGGGGVPVFLDANNELQPVEAVVDKDLASAMLAAHIGADEFYILTDVPFVYANYNTPQQKVLEFLDYHDTIKYRNSGTFAEGSMAPKINAALRFLEKGGKKSIITEANYLCDKAYGTKITMQYDEDDNEKRMDRL